MNKLVYFLFLVLFSSFYIVNSANVEINVSVDVNDTYFDYTFNFLDTESFDKFSFEKPKNSIMISAKDDKMKDIFYSSAGDFFIFNPESTSNHSFHIIFKTDSVSDVIAKNKVFKVYENFNIPVDNLQFYLNFDGNFGHIVDVFPRNYYSINDKSYYWNISSVGKDNLFLINFKGFVPVEDNFKTPVSYFENYFNIILFVIILIVIIVVYFFRKLLSDLISLNLELIKKQNNSSNNSGNMVKNVNSNSFKEDNIKENIEDNNNNNLNEENLDFDSFIKKYLTENEIDVVLVVKDEQGITQNNILDYIDGMKKSNLSKIITKLHGKKILNRVKVGKVNKIYFGEKLNKYL